MIRMRIRHQSNQTFNRKERWKAGEYIEKRELSAFHTVNLRRSWFTLTALLKVVVDRLRLQLLRSFPDLLTSVWSQLPRQLDQSLSQGRSMIIVFYYSLFHRTSDSRAHTEWKVTLAHNRTLLKLWDFRVAGMQRWKNNLSFLKTT